MDPTVEALRAWHVGRDPFLLKLKWAKLATGPMAFFRGTAPLFYDRWTARSLPKAPHVWVCGDAHLENIGSYKGENGVAYFDLNDFDESCRAPAHWDIGRALTCLQIAGRPALAADFLVAYLGTLRRGKSTHLEPEVARSPVSELLAAVRDRKRRTFLAKRVSRGRLRLIPNHTYALAPNVRAAALGTYRAWAARQTPRSFFQPLDICGRIAGNGSLGVERYVVLVRGGRLPHLMDMKQAAPCAAAAHLPSQPRWSCPAERVATAQFFLQYVPAAHLGWTTSARTSYVLRELQPLDDRIDEGKLSRSDFRSLVGVWGRLVASAHLHASGWKGAATIDELIAYARSQTKADQSRLLAAARRTATELGRAYRQFKSASLVAR